jgi:Universal stress protein UspA and related nucleotide-binding proteins
MPLKDLLVHLDDTPHAGARLDAAITLATRHDAHLIGLYVVTNPSIPGYARLQIPKEIESYQLKVIEAAAQRAESMFQERVRLAGVNGEWRRVTGDVVHQVALHGRYADVVIVGQRDPRSEQGTDDPNMPDQLILSIGRPALVVPFVGTFPRIGGRIMVAWDASRLATRAVNDALPFMIGAGKVVVMAVNPHPGNDGHGEIPSADICLHLARHGVNAEAQHIYANDIDAGSMLLSRAADEGIDLLVSGAYGHARWRELVLGGVTRHLLRHMTVPVLMSH